LGIVDVLPNFTGIPIIETIGFIPFVVLAEIVSAIPLMWLIAQQQHPGIAFRTSKVGLVVRYGSLVMFVATSWVLAALMVVGIIYGWRAWANIDPLPASIHPADERFWIGTLGITLMWALTIIGLFLPPRLERRDYRSSRDYINAFRQGSSQPMTEPGSDRHRCRGNGSTLGEPEQE
jgi:hypothetical protein